MRHIAMIRPGSGVVEVRTRCPECTDYHTVSVPREAYVSWMSGGLIQNVLADLSEDDRGRLVSGYCPTHWQEMFSAFEEVEDEDDEWSPDTLNR